MSGKIWLKSKLGFGLLAVALVTFFSACGAQQSPSTTENAKTDTSLLDKVKQRGKLICGVSGKLPGFSFVKEDGSYSGMDADFCRAVAAALFDDPDKVEFRNLSSQQRFTAVQTGTVDLLARNTTKTMSRDTAVRLEFAPIIFYDGQGMMVPANSGVKSLKDLQKKTICVKAGTTTELNLADRMSKLGIEYTPVVIDDEDALYASYAQGRCEGITSDRSQLIARRSVLANPDEHEILSEVMSKEPLAPAVINGDPKWSDAIRWITYALIQAEEFGITKNNLNTFNNTSDSTIKRFLGAEGTLGSDAGLPNDFAVRIIKHVGNYGEIYQSNIGEEFNVDRGLNELWTKGGLMYSPPFR
ncbi:MAG: amino acid ABC transporter substrate-binding protein [Prochloraceae cyanobacterium]|nr:amino acid ABC transporter substrate-binding protein [Prochloraceae cyanobacterium]